MNGPLCFFQTTLEKQNRTLHGDIGDKTQRLDDLHTSLAEADITKKKLSVEKADLEKQIDEADKTLRALGKIKSSLTTQVSSTFFFDHEFEFSRSLSMYVFEYESRLMLDVDFN